MRHRQGMNISLRDVVAIRDSNPEPIIHRRRQQTNDGPPQSLFYLEFFVFVRQFLPETLSEVTAAAVVVNGLAVRPLNCKVYQILQGEHFSEQLSLKVASEFE